MRNHVLSKMNGDEVEEYLARGGDTIFIAVGVVECHGTLPVDCETIGPEAYAIALAEKYDALAMIDLPYFYPGGTVISNATIHMSIQYSIACLTQICRSLIDQGFKKLVLVSGHGPASVSINAFIRDFYEKYHIHPIHLSTMILQLKAFDNDFMKMQEETKYLIYGQYQYMGQKEYIPVDPDAEESSIPRKQTEPELTTFIKAVRDYGGYASALSILYSDPAEHGGGIVLRSEEERTEICNQGEKVFREIIEKTDLTALLDALGDYQDYTRRMVEKYPRLNALGHI